jgi:glycosyltransferase involved in cell wall biosynthesis
MKIVYIHQYFRTPSQNGGIRSYQFADALARRGHDVHVVTAGSPSSPGADDLPSGVTVHWIDVPYDNRMSFVRRVRAFISFAIRASGRSRRLRGDRVIATSTPLTIVVPAVAATWGRSTPFVFEARDVWPSVPIAMGLLRNPILKAGARLLERLAYRRASHIIALSPGMRSQIEERGVPRAPVDVITNISDIDRFSAPDRNGAHLRALVPPLGDRPVALYTGTFGRANGLGWLVDLARAARSAGSDLAFVAVGEGREKAEVVDRARSEGLLGLNVFILDAVAKSDLPHLVASATVCLSLVIDVAELEHNSANKFFDALAAGRPVAINHGGWQAETLASSGAGVRLPRDTAAAVRILDDLVTDPDRLARTGAAASRLARESFSLGTLSERFCDVVEAPGRSPA